MKFDYETLAINNIILGTFLVIATVSLTGCVDSNELLLQAIKEKDVAKVQDLLKGDVNLEPANGAYEVRKPLAYASAYGNLQIVKLLVDKGADLNGKVAYGDVPLFKAMEHDNFEILRFLIQQGADVNSPNDYGVTPFSGLCMEPNIELVELAFEHGGNPNDAFVTKVGDGAGQLNFNPTQAAVAYGQLDILEFLIKCGANLEVKDSRGRKLVEIATANDHSKIVTRLTTATTKKRQ